MQSHHNKDKEWHNFQNFAKWYEENWKPWMDKTWQLDKDILVKGSKIYSPETCCLIPNHINSLFIKNDSKRRHLPIGVSYNKRLNKYVAILSRRKRLTHIGVFNTPEEAFQAYKTEKEKYIKEIANEYKKQITEQVYQALMNYQVEITD